MVRMRRVSITSLFTLVAGKRPRPTYRRTRGPHVNKPAESFRRFNPSFVSEKQKRPSRV